MPKFQHITLEASLERMINRTVARTALTDLNPSSIFLRILTSVAREVNDASYQAYKSLDLRNIDRASGDDLDRLALEYNPTEISRIIQQAASGTLVFSALVANPGPGVINIPTGTQVKVPGTSIIAVTTAPGTIAVSATDSAPVAAVMVDGGQDGNVGVGQLTAFVGSSPAGVDQVTNLSAFVGGIDEETDSAFRERLKAYAQSRAKCTPVALETAALSATLGGQTVLYARVFEDPVVPGLVKLYVDDGTGSIETTAAVTGENLTSGTEFPGGVAQGGEQFLYTDNKPLKDSITPVLTKNPGAVALVRDDTGPNGYTLDPAMGQIYLVTPLTAGDDVSMNYTHYTGLIQETQKVIDGDENDRVNYPGYRAAGVLVTVLAPTVVGVNIDIVIAVRDGFDRADLATQARTVISSYVNQLGIGNDVILSEIIERVMALEGMFDVRFLAPTSNIAILEDQLPRVLNAATDIVIS